MTGAATPVERVPLGRDVPVLFGDGFECSADVAGLPPDAVAEFAPGMDALVVRETDEFKVGDVVVLLVSVSVVELESRRDGSVMPFPLNDVDKSESPVEVPAKITLRGDVVSVWSLGLWSGLSHASSLTVSQSHVKIPQRSDAGAFAT